MTKTRATGIAILTGCVGFLTGSFYTSYELQAVMREQSSSSGWYNDGEAYLASDDQAIHSHDNYYISYDVFSPGSLVLAALALFSVLCILKPNLFSRNSEENAPAG